ncbi:MAG: ferrochelatase [Salinirussus sp.]
MTTGIVALNFGEPAEPDRDAVVDYLRRIFLANAPLEDAEDPAARARELAERRAPGLIEEYEAIGGSPLNAQASAQADALESRLQNAGYDVQTYVGMQYTEPFVEDAVDAALADGIDRIVGLPIYPLCGPSTTVIALEELRTAVAERSREVPVRELSGWHRHPDYARLRADAVREYAQEASVDLRDTETALVFSAHGTPVHYLEEGSRYDIYVEEYCSVQAALLDIDEYAIGYQNHENRDIPWTEPEVEELVQDLDAERIVVEPVSFLHEQSETLSELDIELAEEAADAGLEFHRVPIPHDDNRVIDVLADLVEPFLAEFDPEYYQLRQCQCRDEPGTMCLNAPR